jgi:hypothetical protein
MKLVIVGLEPGDHPTEEPLDPAYPSGGRLAKLLGWTAGEFRDRADRVNLWPGRGSPPLRDAAAGANLAPALRGWRVVALGGRAAKALRVSGGLFEWGVGPFGFVAARMPHPSGLSRWWNAPMASREASSFLRGAVRPCVHVEGVDGSGKTTLVRDLAGTLGLEVVPTDGPPATWDECLGRVARRVRPGVLCDRSSGLVSELVYGPVLRGRVVAPGGEEEVWRLVRSVLGTVTFVYCQPPWPRVRPGSRPGEDRGHLRAVRRNLKTLAARYDYVMAEISRAGGQVVGYDWTRQTPAGVARWLGPVPPDPSDVGQGVGAEEGIPCAG